jgi:hypothetical protein
MQVTPHLLVIIPSLHLFKNLAYLFNESLSDIKLIFVLGMSDGTHSQTLETSLKGSVPAGNRKNVSGALEMDRALLWITDIKEEVPVILVDHR